MKEKATLRRLIPRAPRSSRRAYGDFGKFEEFLDEAETKIFKVAQQNRRETYAAAGDMMEEVLHNIEVRTAERQARSPACRPASPSWTSRRPACSART